MTKPHTALACHQSPGGRSFTGLIPQMAIKVEHNPIDHLLRVDQPLDIPENHFPER